MQLFCQQRNILSVLCFIHSRFVFSLMDFFSLSLSFSRVFIYTCGFFVLVFCQSIKRMRSFLKKLRIIFVHCNFYHSGIWIFIAHTCTRAQKHKQMRIEQRIEQEKTQYHSYGRQTLCKNVSNIKATSSSVLVIINANIESLCSLIFCFFCRNRLIPVRSHPEAISGS